MTAEKPLVLIPGRINPRVRERVEATFDCLSIAAPDAALVPQEKRAAVRGVAAMARIDQAFIDAFDKLEIIGHFGVGYDLVDADHAARRGVVVTHTPDVLSDEVADSTIALILNTLREFPKAEAYLRARRWETKGNYPLTRLSLRGRTAGIYGLGRIGMAVARRLEGFGIPVHYHNRTRRSDVAYVYHDSLEKLAAAVDLLVCVVPGGAGTDRAVGETIFRALGPDGVFVNVGRGTTVDEQALIAALASGTIAAAGLDVFTEEPKVPQALIDLPNACLLPHVASASVVTRDAMADLLVDNLVAWFAGKPALTPVAETRALNRSG